jgi:hypothetical protein
VVAVGGDGTANEVLNGLMLAREANPRLRPVMGVVSVGRGNDFAFGVGVPRGTEAGLRALTAGRRMPLDVGRVTGGLYPQGRYFGNGVGIGFDAVVGFEAVKLKRLTGFPSYIVAALRTIFLYFRAPRVRVETDSGPLELSALMVSIMNGRRMGGCHDGASRAHRQRPVRLCIARQAQGWILPHPRFAGTRHASGHRRAHHAHHRHCWKASFRRTRRRNHLHRRHETHRGDHSRPLDILTMPTGNAACASPVGRSDAGARASSARRRPRARASRRTGRSSWWSIMLTSWTRR